MTKKLTISTKIKTKKISIKAVLLCFLLTLCAIFGAFAFDITKSTDLNDSMADLLSFIEQSQVLDNLGTVSATSEDGTSTSSTARNAETMLIVLQYGQIDTCGAIGEASGYKNYHILKYATASDADTAYAYYKNCGYQVCYNAETYLLDTENVETSTYTISINASASHNSWGYDAMNVSYIYDYLQSYDSLETTYVAVLDTGVDTDHTFLADRIAYDYGKNFVSTTDTNTYANKYTSDYEFEDNHYYVDSETHDVSQGHGTHVSGIICDLTPSCVQVVPLKVLNSAGSGNVDDIIEGLEYCITLKQTYGLNLVACNLSLGTSSTDATTIATVKATFDTIVNNLYKNEIFCVTAAGNGGAKGETTSQVSPANCAKAITVGAVAQSSSATDGVEIAYYSTTGSDVDLCAPGSSVYSCINTGGYQNKSGTSMATPHASAVIALLSLMQQYTTFSSIENALMGCLDDLGDEGFDEEYGYGFINLANIVNTSIVYFSTTELYHENSFSLELSLAEGIEGSIYYAIADEGSTSADNFSLYSSAITVSSTCTVLAYAKIIESGGTMTTATFSQTYYVGADDYYKMFTIDSYGTVTGYKGTETSVTVPDTIDSTEVKSLGTAFKENTTLQSIVLPSSCTSIQEEAFYEATSLASITASGVTHVYAKAFYGTNLTECNMPNLQYVGAYAFYGLENLTITTDNITQIDEMGFAYATFSDTLNLSSCVTLQAYALFNYSAISSVVLSSNLQYAEIYSISGVDCSGIDFSGIKILGSQYILSSTDSLSLDLSNCIEVGVLYSNCVTSIKFSSKLNNFQEFGLPDDAIFVVPYMSKIYDYVVEHNLEMQTTTTDGIVYTMSGHNEIKIIDGTAYTGTELSSTLNGYKITQIADNAFYGNTTLQSVNMAYVESIGKNAFISCTSLQALSFANCTTIGEYAFYGTTALISATLNSLTTLGTYAFSGTALTDFYEYSSITSIGDYAIGYNTDGTVNSSLTVHAKYSYFANWLKAKGVTYVAIYSTLKSDQYTYTIDTTITIPTTTLTWVSPDVSGYIIVPLIYYNKNLFNSKYGTLTIAEEVFANNPNILGIAFYQDVILEEHAIYNLVNLQELDSAHIIYLSTECLYNLPSLTSLSFSSVSIESLPFCYLDNLQSLTISSWTVKSTDDDGKTQLSGLWEFTGNESRLKYVNLNCVTSDTNIFSSAYFPYLETISLAKATTITEEAMYTPNLSTLIFGDNLNYASIYIINSSNNIAVYGNTYAQEFAKNNDFTYIDDSNIFKDVQSTFIIDTAKAETLFISFASTKTSSGVWQISTDGTTFEDLEETDFDIEYDIGTITQDETRYFRYLFEDETVVGTYIAYFLCSGSTNYYVELSCNDGGEIDSANSSWGNRRFVGNGTTLSIDIDDYFDIYAITLNGTQQTYSTSITLQNLGQNQTFDVQFVYHMFYVSATTQSTLGAVLCTDTGGNALSGYINYKTYVKVIITPNNDTIKITKFTINGTDCISSLVQDDQEYIFIYTEQSLSTALVVECDFDYITYDIEISIIGKGSVVYQTDYDDPYTITSSTTISVRKKATLSLEFSADDGYEMCYLSKDGDQLDLVDFSSTVTSSSTICVQFVKTIADVVFDGTTGGSVFLEENDSGTETAITSLNQTYKKGTKLTFKLVADEGYVVYKINITNTSLDTTTQNVTELEYAYYYNDVKTNVTEYTFDMDIYYDYTIEIIFDKTFMFVYSNITNADLGTSLVMQNQTAETLPTTNDDYYQCYYSSTDTEEEVQYYLTFTANDGCMIKSLTITYGDEVVATCQDQQRYVFTITNAYCTGGQMNVVALYQKIYNITVSISGTETVQEVYDGETYKLDINVPIFQSISQVKINGIKISLTTSNRKYVFDDSNMYAIYKDGTLYVYNTTSEFTVTVDTELNIVHVLIAVVIGMIVLVFISFLFALKKSKPRKTN